MSKPVRLWSPYVVTCCSVRKTPGLESKYSSLFPLDSGSDNEHFDLPDTPVTPAEKLEEARKTLLRFPRREHVASHQQPDSEEEHKADSPPEQSETRRWAAARRGAVMPSASVPRDDEDEEHAPPPTPRRPDHWAAGRHSPAHQTNTLSDPHHGPSPSMGAPPSAPRRVNKWGDVIDD
mmetsp:Transcript_35250/g.76272  ORF Transcript_35250/g.76272 Transcript_35250/m.76272 type:complete len:178 (-) Transcript_35250:28-561(-)